MRLIELSDDPINDMDDKSNSDIDNKSNCDTDNKSNCDIDNKSNHDIDNDLENFEQKTSAHSSDVFCRKEIPDTKCGKVMRFLIGFYLIIITIFLIILLFLFFETILFHTFYPVLFEWISVCYQTEFNVVMTILACFSDYGFVFIFMFLSFSLVKSIVSTAQELLLDFLKKFGSLINNCYQNPIPYFYFPFILVGF